MVKSFKRKKSYCWCGAQGLNQGLNRDSGLDISYESRSNLPKKSFMNAADNGFSGNL
jgi:ketol-acid reductoisomerase